MAASSVTTGAYISGRLSKALSGNVTLSEAEQFNGILEFTGTLGAGAAVTLYSATDGQAWDVFNDAGDTVTSKVSGGTGVAIADGKRARVYCDGTDVRRVSPTRDDDDDGDA